MLESDDEWLVYGSDTDESEGDTEGSESGAEESGNEAEDGECYAGDGDDEAAYYSEA